MKLPNDDWLPSFIHIALKAGCFVEIYGDDKATSEDMAKRVQKLAQNDDHHIMRSIAGPFGSRLFSGGASISNWPTYVIAFEGSELITMQAGLWFGIQEGQQYMFDESFLELPPEQAFGWVRGLVQSSEVDS
jgi:hypothetical protein